MPGSNRPYIHSSPPNVKLSGNRPNPIVYANRTIDRINWQKIIEQLFDRIVERAAHQFGSKSTRDSP